MVSYVKKQIYKNLKKFNFQKFPDKNGRFGEFGGRFVAETLMPFLLDVESEYKRLKSQKNLKVKLTIILKTISVDQVLFILQNVYLKRLIMQRFISSVMN